MDKIKIITDEAIPKDTVYLMPQLKWIRYVWEDFETGEEQELLETTINPKNFARLDWIKVED